MPRKPTFLTKLQKDEIILKLQAGGSANKIAKQYMICPKRAKRIAGMDDGFITIDKNARETKIRTRTTELQSKWIDFQIGKKVKVKEQNCRTTTKYEGEIIFKGKNYFTITDKTNRKMNINFGDFCTNYYIEII